MNKKETEKIDKLIHTLDDATGRLLVASMKDETVKKAMEEVSLVSFELGNLL